MLHNTAATKQWMTEWLYIANNEISRT